VTEFCPGWHPEFASRSRVQFAASGGRFQSATFGDDARPLPPGFSLSRFRRWPFDQSVAYGIRGDKIGTCWENAGTQAFQIHTAADGAFEAVPLSRCMTGWQGKKLEGGGSPADGGSVLDAFRAMSDPPDGVGCCHEELWPYHPDRRYFAAGPPDGAVADAGLNRVHGIADNLAIGDGWKRPIFNSHPVGIGIWWPYGWDTSVDSTGRATGIGNGQYGHALAVIGWLDGWDGATWWQIENSHGPIYRVVPSDIASRIIGYAPAFPDKTHDFWVRDDWMRSVLGYGNAEAIAATGLTGFKKRILDFSDMM